MALTVDNRGNRILSVGVDDVPDCVIVTEAFGVMGLTQNCVTGGSGAGGGGTGSNTAGIGGFDGAGGEGARSTTALVLSRACLVFRRPRLPPGFLACREVFYTTF